MNVSRPQSANQGKPATIVVRSASTPLRLATNWSAARQRIFRGLVPGRGESDKFLLTSQQIPFDRRPRRPAACRAARIGSPRRAQKRMRPAVSDLSLEEPGGPEILDVVQIRDLCSRGR